MELRGEITSYDYSTQTGVIRGQDGSSYVFTLHDIQSANEVTQGMSVDFVPQGSTATQIFLLETTTASAAAAAFGNAAGSSHSPAAPTGDYDVKWALLTFDGRLRRQHFWISWLIILGIGVVAGWLPLIGLLISLALIWPNVAITVKRLHDMGKSGWLTLVPYIGSFIGLMVIFVGGAGAVLMNAATGSESSQAAVMSALGALSLGGLIMLIANLGFLIWIGITDSQPGDNQYGPNPKGL